jgi:hypothetical protein
MRFEQPPPLYEYHARLAMVYNPMIHYSCYLVTSKGWVYVKTVMAHVFRLLQVLSKTSARLGQPAKVSALETESSGTQDTS